MTNSKTYFKAFGVEEDGWEYLEYDHEGCIHQIWCPDEGDCEGWSWHKVAERQHVIDASLDQMLEDWRANHVDKLLRKSLKRRGNAGSYTIANIDQIFTPAGVLWHSDLLYWQSYFMAG